MTMESRDDEGVPPVDQNTVKELTSTLKESAEVRKMFL